MLRSVKHGWKIDWQNPVNWKHPLTQGLLHWWMPIGNYIYGPTLYDLASTADGTRVNGPVWKPGVVPPQFDGEGGCLEFVASNSQYVNIGSSPLFDASATAFTVSSFILVDPNDFDGSFMHLMGTSVNPNGENGFVVVLDDRGATNGVNAVHVVFNVNAPEPDIVDFVATNVLTSKKWYHIAVTYDGVGDEHIYVDGIDQSVSYKVHATGAFQPRNAALQIGTTNTSFFLSGLICETRIYNRALNEGEVSLLSQGLASQMFRFVPYRRVSAPPTRPGYLPSRHLQRPHQALIRM